MQKLYAVGAYVVVGALSSRTKLNDDVADVTSLSALAVVFW